MGKFKDFLNEKYGAVYSRTCLMADVPKYLNLAGIDDSDEVVSLQPGEYNSFVNFVSKFVKKDDLYESDGKQGVETYPHVTVLWGMNPENDEKDLATIKRLIKPTSTFTIKLGKVDKFRNDNCDVLFVQVQPSVALNNLHGLIKNNVENDYEYPEYKPHLTLAFVKNGACEELVGNTTFEGMEFLIDHLDFSMRDGTYKSIYIPYSKAEVKLQEDNQIPAVVTIAPVKPIEEDTGASTVAPTSVADGQYPTRAFYVSRKGGEFKKFKDVYKGVRYSGIAFLNPNSSDNSGSEGGDGGSGH